MQFLPTKKASVNFEVTVLLEQRIQVLKTSKRLLLGVYKLKSLLCILLSIKK